MDLDGYPEGTRIIVRRERPHPGGQLALFDLGEGMRHQVFLSTPPHLAVGHRAPARVEDRILCGMTTGFGCFPSRHVTINTAWLELCP